MKNNETSGKLEKRRILDTKQNGLPDRLSRDNQIKIIIRNFNYRYSILDKNSNIKKFNA